MSQSDPKLLDFRGYRCPVPVIRLEASMRNFPETVSFWVVSDDPVAAVDIPHFCRESGHSIEPVADDNSPVELQKTSNHADFCVFLVTRDAKTSENL